jgi:hypothetical protein
MNLAQRRENAKREREKQGEIRGWGIEKGKNGLALGILWG